MYSNNKDRSSATKEQFEMLGEFVQAFEQMVHTARFCCLFLLSRDLAISERSILSSTIKQ
jgi:hypothetical protein